MHCKSYSHFFSKIFQHICVSLDVNFNELLTNDMVSFEQLGADIKSEQQIILGAFGYLTPSKLNQLGKIVFSFFGMSKNTPQNEN